MVNADETPPDISDRLFEMIYNRIEPDHLKNQH